MSFRTADLCDAHHEHIQIAEPLLRPFGGRARFFGPMSTVKAYEDNTQVRRALDEPGLGRVLVIDGGGSLRCAMLGDQLASLAQRNGWSGVIVHGCIRDSEDIAKMDLGVLALGTHPKKTEKRGEGQRDLVVRFAGVDFVPGHNVYADPDGIVTSERPLLREEGDGR
jgi:regulator of ribonuclease activity A